MPTQSLAPWTPLKVLHAMVAWVMAETPVMIAPAAAQKTSRA